MIIIILLSFALTVVRSRFQMVQLGNYQQLQSQVDLIPVVAMGSVNLVDVILSMKSMKIMVGVNENIQFSVYLTNGSKINSLGLLNLNAANQVQLEYFWDTIEPSLEAECFQYYYSFENNERKLKIYYPLNNSLDDPVVEAYIIGFNVSNVTNSLNMGILNARYSNNLIYIDLKCDQGLMLHEIQFQIVSSLQKSFQMIQVAKHVNINLTNFPIRILFDAYDPLVIFGGISSFYLIKDPDFELNIDLKQNEFKHQANLLFKKQDSLEYVSVSVFSISNWNIIFCTNQSSLVTNYNNLILIDQKCIYCDKKCSQCEGSTDQCLKCVSPDAKIYDNCNCETGFYFDYDQIKCIQCKYSCQVCQSDIACVQCNDALMYEGDSSGHCVCQSGYFELDIGFCQKCHQMCQTCLEYDLCTSCIQSTMYLLYNKCECKDSYYFDFLHSLDCQRCDRQCQTCYLDSNRCTSCSKAMDLSGFKCECKSNTFYNIEIFICTLCSSQCKTCFGGGVNQCLSCEPEHFRILNISNCDCLVGYQSTLNKTICELIPLGNNPKNYNKQLATYLNKLQIQYLTNTTRQSENFLLAFQNFLEATNDSAFMQVLQGFMIFYLLLGNSQAIAQLRFLDYQPPINSYYVQCALGKFSMNIYCPSWYELNLKIESQPQHLFGIQVDSINQDLEKVPTMFNNSKISNIFLLHNEIQIVSLFVMLLIYGIYALFGRKYIRPKLRFQDNETFIMETFEQIEYMKETNTTNRRKLFSLTLSYVESQFAVIFTSLSLQIRYQTFTPSTGLGVFSNILALTYLVIYLVYSIGQNRLLYFYYRIINRLDHLIARQDVGFQRAREALCQLKTQIRRQIWPIYAYKNLTKAFGIFHFIVSTFKKISYCIIMIAFYGKVLNQLILLMILETSFLIYLILFRPYIRLSRSVLEVFMTILMLIILGCKMGEQSYWDILDKDFEIMKQEIIYNYFALGWVSCAFQLLYSFCLLLRNFDVFYSIYFEWQQDKLNQKELDNQKTTQLKNQLSIIIGAKSQNKNSQGQDEDEVQYFSGLQNLQDKEQWAKIKGRYLVEIQQESEEKSKADKEKDENYIKFYQDKCSKLEQENSKKDRQTEVVESSPMQEEEEQKIRIEPMPDNFIELYSVYE